MYDLTQLISSPTNEFNGTINLLMMNKNESELVNNIHILKRLPLQVSDYYRILFHINLVPEKVQEKITVATQRFENSSLPVFKDMLNNSDDLKMVTSAGSDVNQSVAVFNHVLS